VKYTIYVDTNDDGNFSGSNDRRVLVDYHPKFHHSDVRVRVKRGSGGETLYSAEGDWGESIAEGGRKVEVAVFWDDLDISAGNVIRMYVESNWNDRLPNSGDIQWSPASILGFWLLSALLAVGAVALWRIKKRKEQKCLSGLE
jgi:LPXTG-motif cell wall-anchored protein